MRSPLSASDSDAHTLEAERPTRNLVGVPCGQEALHREDLIMAQLEPEPDSADGVWALVVSDCKRDATALRDHTALGPTERSRTERPAWERRLRPKHSHRLGDPSSPSALQTAATQHETPEPASCPIHYAGCGLTLIAREVVPLDPMEGARSPARPRCHREFQNAAQRQNAFTGRTSETDLLY